MELYWNFHKFLFYKSLKNNNLQIILLGGATKQWNLTGKGQKK